MKTSLNVLLVLIVVSISGVSAHSQSIESLKQMARDLTTNCSEAGCFSTRSFQLPENLGRLLRESCSSSVECWKASTEFLIKNPLNLKDQDSAAKYQAGLLVNSCTAIPWKKGNLESVGISWNTKFGKYDQREKPRRECFNGGLLVLEQTAGQYGHYMSFIKSTCEAGRNRELALQLNQRLSRYPTITTPLYYSAIGFGIGSSECEAQGLQSLSQMPLPRSLNEDIKSKFRLLAKSCMGHPDFISEGCFKQGLSEIQASQSNYRVDAIKEGCTWAGCFQAGIQFLSNPPDLTTLAENTKYTADLILNMCSSTKHPALMQSGGKDQIPYFAGECIQQAISSIAAQDIQQQHPELRPLYEVLRQCKDDLKCYFLSLKSTAANL